MEQKNDNPIEQKNTTQKKSFWKDKKNIAIVILSFLLFCGLASSDTSQLDEINRLKSQATELNQQIESQSAEIAELKSNNNAIQEAKAKQPCH